MENLSTWFHVQLTSSTEVTLRWVVSKTLQHTFEHTNNILRIALFWDFVAEQEESDE
jgi:hypothetical protein